MSSEVWKPELLAPAKNVERLQVAIAYGADAVYVGGQRYGLRARADNLTDAELELAVQFAHAHGSKLYVTLNAFLHDEDFEGLEETCQFLEHIGIDALIVSDLGVLRQVRQFCSVDVHLSTQASCLNAYAGQMWKQMGVKRLILGRELTVQEGGAIFRSANLDVELFAHGAMCMAYSGHCTISNFTAGRDSNRGGCSQSCRFAYSIHPEHASASEVKQSTQETPTLLSSKDLAGIRSIPEFFQQRICSLKIEGRMKSSFYVATACKAYRQLIDAYAEGRWSEALVRDVEMQLHAVPHRAYTSGSLEHAADQSSIFQQESSISVGTHKGVGMVLESTGERIILRTQMPLKLGDSIEFLPFSDKPFSYTIEELHTLQGQSIPSTKQDSVVSIPKTSLLRDICKRTVIRSRQITA